jgi:hypothetical protein
VLLNVVKKSPSDDAHRAYGLRPDTRSSGGANVAAGAAVAPMSVAVTAATPQPVRNVPRPVAARTTAYPHRKASS